MTKPKLSGGTIVSAELLDEDWMIVGNCKGYSPELFFEGYEKADVDERKDILAICNGVGIEGSECVVREKCFKYAQETKSIGVFGGTYFVGGRVHKNPVTFRDKENSE